MGGAGGEGGGEQQLESIDPLRLLYKFYKTQMVTVCAIAALWSTAFYILYVWMATWEATFVRYPHPDSAFGINTGILTTQVLLSE